MDIRMSFYLPKTQTLYSNSEAGIFSIAWNQKGAQQQQDGHKCPYRAWAEQSSEIKCNKKKIKRNRKYKNITGKRFLNRKMFWIFFMVFNQKRCTAVTRRA